MQPQGVLSEAGKVLAELGRQLRAEKKMPADSLREFIDLMKAYAKMVSAVQGESEAKSGGRMTREDVQKWINRHGIPGSYEAMAASAEQAERKRKGK